MTSKPQVIAQVVDNDMCIGCGLCTYNCPSDALTMRWNEEGFLIPELTGVCDNDASCISVCPFNPAPVEAVKDETAIADIFLSNGTESHEKLGRLIGIYAAYSNEFRETSSSGGIATYVFDQLLDKGIVDHVFSVHSSGEAGSHYQYKVASNHADLRDSAKTKYYPVTLATVLPELERLEGKVAIVGIACFVKAIRLAQYHAPALKEKIPFVAGIICGGVKSKFFTEYLASKAGADYDNIQSPNYRIKDITSTASDYSFGCVDVANKKYKAYSEIRTDGVYVESGENDNLIVQKLTKNEAAVGIFGYSFLAENKDKVVGLSIDNVFPTVETIANSSYPVARSMYFYIKNQHL